jgi:cytochrome oxidase Cu insertion factor (SCO1/SenC/PrrC family)
MGLGVRVGAVVVVAAGALACSKQSEVAVEEPKSARPLETVRVGGPAPSFRAKSLDGQWFDSKDLVGRRAFAVLSFATWCEVCPHKLPLVREAARDRPEVLVIAVTLDDESTLGDLDGYLKQTPMGFPVVIGMKFPRFGYGYDPRGVVPAVAVVGRDGVVIDYQTGISSSDRERLAWAFEKARAARPSR